MLDQPIHFTVHHLMLYLAAFVLAMIGLAAWFEGRTDNVKLASTIEAQKQIMAAADARTKEREDQFKQIVADANQTKKSVQTPQQIVDRLPQYINFPNPVRLEPEHSPVTGEVAGAGDNLLLDPENQKVMFDRLVDCKLCADEREKQKADIADLGYKLRSTQAERDAAITAAKGGSFWKRTGRITKWLAIGAAAGFAISKMQH